eukprot:366126-Chlamydomonas_euryale.AAC.10
MISVDYYLLDIIFVQQGGAAGVVALDDVTANCNGAAVIHNEAAATTSDDVFLDCSRVLDQRHAG